MIRKTKRLLLTGISGFISHNIYDLLHRTYEITAPTHQEVNLVDRQAVDKLFFKTYYDYVIHCAHVGKYHNAMEYPSSINENIQMARNLILYNKQFGKCIYIGSGAVYDKSRSLENIPETEFGMQIPQDPYGRAKFECSKLFLSIKNAVVVHPFGVYGEYEDYQRRFISNTICRLIYKRPITINKNVIIDYLYIRDFVKVIDYLLINNYSESLLNIGSGNPIDIVSLTRVIFNVFNIEFNAVIRNKGMQPQYSGSIGLLKKIMTDKFPVSKIEKNIEFLSQWYKERKKFIDSKNL